MSIVILALAAAEGCWETCCHSPQLSVHTGSQRQGHPILIPYTLIHRGMFTPGWDRIGLDMRYTAPASAVKP